MNCRRYKDKDYAQGKVDNCFQGPKKYLRKIFGNPVIFEKEGCLALVYALDEEPLKKFANRDGFFPVVINVYEQSYSTEELFLRARRKYRVKQPMRYLKSRIKIRPIFLHLDERIRDLS